MSWVLVLSLGLHLLFFSGLLLVRQPHQERTQIQVVYKSTPPLMNPGSDKPFIRNLQIPKKLLFENDDPSLFSSKERRRVLLETQARKKGLTQNRQLGPRFLEPFQDDIGKEKNLNLLMAQEGLPVLDIKGELGQLEQGESTISVELPNQFAAASFTALNTDRNLYYSFYSRIEKQFYFRWSKLLDRAYNSFTPEQRRLALRAGLLKTEMVIFLNPQGEFHHAEMHSSSGVQKIDISPALAFQEARLFPNPPKEMVREDGFIHLSYSFIVDFRRVQ